MNRSFNSTIVIGFLLVQLLWSVARAEDRNLAVVTPAGRELAARLDAMDVEHHWLPGMSIEWRSGKSLHPVTEHGVHTHCSAFVAAACERLGVAILSPPPQVHLANKQGDWLLAEGKKLGWREVTALDAQALANEGRVVVASFRNRDAKYHSGTGHIAIVRPAAKTPSDLRSDGPQIIQAGNRNFASGPLSEGFGAPARPQVRYFAWQPR